MEKNLISWKFTYIRQDNFKQTLQNLELKDAHVGFTASSGEFAADITVEDFVFRTIEIDISQTRLDPITITEPQQITADGEDVSEGVRIVTSDLCGTQLATGNLDASVIGFFIEQPNDTGGFFSGESAEITEATVIDNGDGTYQIALSTLIPGSFSLVVAFGDGCGIEFDANAVPSLSADDGIQCFFQQFDDGSVVVEAVEATESPTSSPTATPTKQPSSSPTKSPLTSAPSISPTSTSSPTNSPTTTPTTAPSTVPTFSPSVKPTNLPTSSPAAPTKEPTNEVAPTPAKEESDLVSVVAGVLATFIGISISGLIIFFRKRNSTLDFQEEPNEKVAARV